MDTRWDQETEDKLIELWNAGVGGPQIAKRLGQPFFRVSRKIARLRNSGVIKGHYADGVWSGGKVDLLIELWSGGMSGSLVAEKLGLTRSQVIGKIARLRRSGELEKGEEARKSKPHNRRDYPGSRKIRVEKIKQSAQPEPPKDEPDAMMIGLMQLKREHCRWPHGDPKTPTFGFCGHKTDVVYCRYHDRMSRLHK